MPIPNLLHPVTVVLRQKALADTAMDEDAREPIQVVERDDAVNIQGQPRFKSLGMTASYHPGGVQVATEGYVLFRYVDLRAQSITLAHGDRITNIGNIECDIYIERLEPTAPYPDQGGPTMVKAHCRDRVPARGVG